MSNMLDYIDWRGDITFEQSRFNEVDNLIFSQVCYAPFDDLLDESGEVEKSVAQVADEYFMRYSLKQRAKMDTQEIRATSVLEKMAQSKRFRDCKLSCFVSQTDLQIEKQFAAITIDLMGDAIYIAYRGTDNTLVGWKEDFKMCYSSHVEGQIDALHYFENVAKRFPDKKFFLGGHSKGGNLATYAAIMCSKELKERIIAVYNNDGPGFRKDIIESQQYHEILPKIRTIVPESSIVGMLLEHQEEYTVVRSTQTGGMQHDATSWEVLGRHFIYLETTSVGSHRIDSTISAWLNDLEPEEMQVAVDAMFSVLMAAGFSTLSAIQKEPLKNAMMLLKGMTSLDAETRKYVTTVVSALVKEGNRTVRKVIPIPFEAEEEGF